MEWEFDGAETGNPQVKVPEAVLKYRTWAKVHRPVAGTQACVLVAKGIIQQQVYQGNKYLVSEISSVIMILISDLSDHVVVGPNLFQQDH